jgi:hypothetical protein
MKGDIKHRFCRPPSPPHPKKKKISDGQTTHKLCSSLGAGVLFRLRVKRPRLIERFKVPTRELLQEGTTGTRRHSVSLYTNYRHTMVFGNHTYAQTNRRSLDINYRHTMVFGKHKNETQTNRQVTCERRQTQTLIKTKREQTGML